jgi:predicted unusual protein kinase regulating ubiquinone biosynthesis (AarF/ABC1/UbiB family)
LEKCSALPIAGGGFGDIYKGTLSGGEKVAIKCPRLYLKNDEDGRKIIRVRKYF